MKGKLLCYLQAAEVIYNDPYIPQIKIDDKKVRSLPLGDNKDKFRRENDKNQGYLR